ncbi:MAG: electron transfer flavoprotein subunit beta/FixA family protein [Promethearchaeota archaeon]|nr:MAG: electron transfer flavoprotein subunit beta/FixA family protein [Candidatus Lokiarchaeota archaeon]
MKIIVCIKQVPGIAEVRIDPKTGVLVREGVPSIINPVDKNALELAIQLKEQTGSETIAISMGPPQAEEALREALSMGIDIAYLLTDRKFAGADTLATSYTLSVAINKILRDNTPNEPYLVICGSQAIDGDTAQVGPELAEELQIPQITNVRKMTLEGTTITAECLLRPEEIFVMKTELPALITVLKEINMPRHPNLIGIVDAYDNKVVLHWTVKHLDIDETKIGIKGSQTQVGKIFIPQQKGEHLKLSGSVKEMVTHLCQNLKEDKVVFS